VADLSPVEGIKTRSRGLRGSLVESLADPVTGAIAEDDTQLIKFHGSYQQDDRDQRDERRQQKLEPAYSFMIRTRLPGGVATPTQWLALDALTREFGNGTLKLTTRQAFQVHGVVKRHLKDSFRALNQVAIDCIAACGDVNRNVMAGINPAESALHAEVHAFACGLSEHLLPHTKAYHEVWLDGQKLTGEAEREPLYGPTYLPRKFKAAVVLPPHNDVDIFTQDLGFIAIVEKGKLIGFNLTAGGGLGATHGESATFPRLADVIGYFPKERLNEVAAAVMTTQRDFGDRTNRKHARLKYTIHDLGLPWFKEELARRLGGPLEAPKPVSFKTRGDRFGWIKGTNDRWNLTLRVPGGRVLDGPEQRWCSGLRAYAERNLGELRLTPNQNLMLAEIPESEKAAVTALVASYGLGIHETATRVSRDALACVALPTCPLAMAEAERYMVAFSARIDELLVRHGLAGEAVSVRITGCPNGCARPYVAEIALIGKAPGRYNLMLGSDALGTRLNVLYRENIDEATILAALDPLIAGWAAGRQKAESFGDWCVRSEVVPSSAASVA
jgi:sulfite reductase (NADPH) hemoprotein beta-component